jgi:threonine aldolase
MRQAGVLAAAGLLALRDGPALLAADHRRAKALAQALAALPLLRVDVAATETNIVMVEVSAAAVPDFVAALRARNVLASTSGPQRVRFVTHRDVGDDGVAAAIAAAQAFAGRPVPLICVT